MADEEEEQPPEDEPAPEPEPEPAPAEEPAPAAAPPPPPAPAPAPPPPAPAPAPAKPEPPRGQSIIPQQDQVSEEMDFSVSEGVDSEGRPSHKTKRPTEEIAMRLPPRIIIDKLSKYYKEFITVREELRAVEKEFGKLDRKRNRWKATEEELNLRLEKKKELKEKRVVFDLINLKITKLKEAAEAKDINPNDLPPEPPPFDEDEEDVCLPDDALPRVIVCNGYRPDRNDALPEVPKIVVCLDDRCKPPPPPEEETKVEEEAPQPVEGKKKAKKHKTAATEETKPTPTQS